MMERRRMWSLVLHSGFILLLCLFSPLDSKSEGTSIVGQMLRQEVGQKGWSRGCKGNSTAWFGGSRSNSRVASPGLELGLKMSRRMKVPAWITRTSSLQEIHTNSDQAISWIHLNMIRRVSEATIRVWSLAVASKILSTDLSLKEIWGWRRRKGADKQRPSHKLETGHWKPGKERIARQESLQNKRSNADRSTDLQSVCPLGRSLNECRNSRSSSRHDSVMIGQLVSCWHKTWDESQGMRVTSICSCCSCSSHLGRSHLMIRV